jgi:hypothetical protein
VLAARGVYRYDPSTALCLLSIQRLPNHGIHQQQDSLFTTCVKFLRANSCNRFSVNTENDAGGPRVKASVYMERILNLFLKNGANPNEKMSTKYVAWADSFFKKFKKNYYPIELGVVCQWGKNSLQILKNMTKHEVLLEICHQWRPRLKPWNSPPPKVFDSWQTLRAMAMEVRSLRHMCKLVLRESLDYKLYNLDKVGLPDPLKAYVRE